MIVHLSLLLCMIDNFYWMLDIGKFSVTWYCCIPLKSDFVLVLSPVAWDLFDPLRLVFKLCRMGIEHPD